MAELRHSNPSDIVSKTSYSRLRQLSRLDSDRQNAPRNGPATCASRAVSCVFVHIVPTNYFCSSVCCFGTNTQTSITNTKLQPRAQEAYFETFAMLHSGWSRTPLYFSEHLTHPRIILMQINIHTAIQG